MIKSTLSGILLIILSSYAQIPVYVDVTLQGPNSVAFYKFLKLEAEKKGYPLVADSLSECEYAIKLTSIDRPICDTSSIIYYVVFTRPSADNINNIKFDEYSKVQSQQKLSTEAQFVVMKIKRFIEEQEKAKIKIFERLKKSMNEPKQQDGT